MYNYIIIYIQINNYYYYKAQYMYNNYIIIYIQINNYYYYKAQYMYNYIYIYIQINTILKSSFNNTHNCTVTQY